MTQTSSEADERPGLRPGVVKTVGYLISSASVLLLGIAAYPGAAKAGLELVLAGGMATSLAGMAMRWWSYEMEKRKTATKPPSR